MFVYLLLVVACMLSLITLIIVFALASYLAMILNERGGMSEENPITVMYCSVRKEDVEDEDEAMFVA